MDTQTLPDRLRAARAARGLTQVQAAGELGVHPLTWAAWEQGRRVPASRMFRVAVVGGLRRGGGEGGHGAPLIDRLDEIDRALGEDQ